MIREYCSYAHVVCVENAFVSHGGKAGVAMNELNALPLDDGPKIREEGKKVGQRRGGCYGDERDVVHLDTR